MAWGDFFSRGPNWVIGACSADDWLWPDGGFSLLAPTGLLACVLANNGLWPRVILGVLTPGPDRCSDVVYLVSIPN